MNASIYIFKEFLLKKNDIINNKIQMFIMRERSIDIDDKFDLYLVKHCEE